MAIAKTPHRFKFRFWNTRCDAMHYYDGDSCSRPFLLFEMAYTCEIMQDTGLTDCDGLSIYEGDIVKIAGVGNVIVSYENGGFLFGDELYHKCSEDLGVVVGNIYQNKNIDIN